MAKRMLSDIVICSDAFLIGVTNNAQRLYFYLNIEADDDGFISSPKKVIRMVACDDSDLEELIKKRFLIGFPSGRVVIKHWLIHNTIQKDRYHPTVYQDEYNLLIVKKNKAYTEDKSKFDTYCIQNGYKVDTEIRLDKVRLDKVRVEEEQTTDVVSAPQEIDKNSEEYLDSLNEIGFVQELFRRQFGVSPVAVRGGKDSKIDLTAMAAKRLVKKHGRDQLRRMLEMVFLAQKNDKYCKICSNALDFEKNYSWYKTYFARLQQELENNKPLSVKD